MLLVGVHAFDDLAHISALTKLKYHANTGIDKVATRETQSETEKKRWGQRGLNASPPAW
jgi:hypothetical protein